jgi:hypothetical protein
MTHKQTIFLDRGKQLTITADEFTTGYYYTQNPGEEPVGYNVISASSVTIIESTTTTRQFIIESNKEVTLTDTFSSNTADSVNTELERRVNTTQATDVAASANQTYTFDFLDGSHQKVTVSSDCTFAFSFPSGEVLSFMIEVINGGSQTITLPAAVDWAGGTEPVFTAAGTDMMAIYQDANDNVFGFVTTTDTK